MQGKTRARAEGYHQRMAAPQDGGSSKGWGWLRQVRRFFFPREARKSRTETKAARRTSDDVLDSTSGLVQHSLRHRYRVAHGQAVILLVGPLVARSDSVALGTQSAKLIS